jgi:hypothetical protein
MRSAKAEQLMLVIPWPSNDFIADDFINKRGPFKESGGDDESEDSEMDQVEQRPIPVTESLPSLPGDSSAAEAAGTKKRRKGIDRTALEGAIIKATVKERNAPGFGGRMVGRFEAALLAHNRQDSSEEAEAATKIHKAKVAEAAAKAASTAAARLLPMPVTSDSDPFWQGGTLRGDVMSGSLAGEFTFPRFDLFQVVLFVSKTKPLDIDQGHKEDALTIRFGPTLKKLTKVSLFIS